MPHSTTGYQFYELMFGCKAQTKNSFVMLAWGWPIIMIRPVRTSGKTLHILIENLVMLRDHPESCNKIQDNYKSELFVVVDNHKDPNVYITQSLDKKGPKTTVNRQQLFYLKSLRYKGDIWV